MGYLVKKFVENIPDGHQRNWYSMLRDGIMVIVFWVFKRFILYNEKTKKKRQFRLYLVSHFFKRL